MNQKQIGFFFGMSHAMSPFLVKDRGDWSSRSVEN
jgi:hypothetical protein